MTSVTQRKVKKTDDFDAWLDGLKDEVGKAAISDRIDRVKNGNLGDVKKVQGVQGLYEIRVDVGPGYRVYFVLIADTIVFILLGGTKRRQDADIAKATEMLCDMRKAQSAGKKKREADEDAIKTMAEKDRKSNKSKGK